MFYTIDSITPVCAQLHADHQKIVLATGFFDLLHSEHINFLKQAKSKGDILIVGVESDTRARALKGEGRPIQSQELRAKHLLPFVDYVILLPDDFSSSQAHESLLRSVQPDIFAVSSHTKHQTPKSQLTAKYGGKLLVVHPHNPKVSTTNIIAQGILSP